MDHEKAKGGEIPASGSEGEIKVDRRDRQRGRDLVATSVVEVITVSEDRG